MIKSKLTVLFIPVMLVVPIALQAQAVSEPERAAIEKAVLATEAQIRAAAEALDPDAVFAFVLENDHGSIIQNGQILLTREDALESTRKGFARVQKVSYKFSREFVTVVAPTVALVTGEGVTEFTVTDGRTLTLPFAHSILFVLTDGQWRVLHTHRSFPVKQ